MARLPEAEKAYRKAYYEKNKDRIKENQRRWYLKNIEIRKLKHRDYYVNNKTKYKKYNKQNQDRVKRLRDAVLDGYGGVCACCTEDHRSMLCIDHVNNGKGNPAKRLSSYKFYKLIVESNFPADYQILCANCNTSKAILGVCQHQRE